ncbi:PepSY domain-containing protein [Actinoplanes sp. NPDC049265]|uniref:PepSY domain-containing protein n=1 Tax=Actinoplanes sp. NPDC049265 TaxID=3363902 RepID=UPI0037153121
MKNVGRVLVVGVFALAGVAGAAGAASAAVTHAPAAVTSSAYADEFITADEAKAIALEASGGGTITKFELKSEHAEYRVEIRNGRFEHRIRLDAVTGEITRHDIKD